MYVYVSFDMSAFCLKRTFIISSRPGENKNKFFKQSKLLIVVYIVSARVGHFSKTYYIKVMLN